MKQDKKGKDGPETRFRQKDIEDLGGQRCPGACRVRKEGNAARRRANVGAGLANHCLGRTGNDIMMPRVHGPSVAPGNPFLT